ncbi:MAG: NAD-glutamate dehydrogenase [Acidimicrobiia bacterium]|nr:NAD-glutamate dehydrogenase [Acidimicrobiia bacterium]
MSPGPKPSHKEAMVDVIADQVGAAYPDRAETAAAFTRAYLRRVGSDYFDTHEDEELTAHVLGLFRLASERRGNEFAVRAFNPDAERDGYSLPVGVVETAGPDMAFLVDSVSNELDALGLGSQRVFHPVIGVIRSADGAMEHVIPARTASARESIQHHELDRLLTETEIEQIERNLSAVLNDVANAVSDFERMQGAVYRMIKIAREGAARYSKEEVDEAVAFLEWMLDDNFVFLGYREYEVLDVGDGGHEDRKIRVRPGSGLGILTHDEDSAFAEPTSMSDLPPDLLARYEEGPLVVVTKTNRLSRVHRRAKMDYVGVRHIGPDGRVIGEARCIGLMTSKAYMLQAGQIPVLRRKLQQIIEAEDLIVGSHSYKEVVQIFDSFPKDELFATPIDDVRSSILGLIELQERQQVRLFIRNDLLQRNVSVLIVMPRDRFNAPLRHRIQDLLLDRYGGKSIDYRLALGETDTARLHFTIWTGTGPVPDVSYEELEPEVVALAKTWEEHLSEHLVERFGPELAAALREEWAGRFPDGYRTTVPLPIAAGDVGKLDELVQASDGRPVVGLQNDERAGHELTRLAVYRADGKLDLSSIMPVLEALGLRVIEEVPTALTSGSQPLQIHDFGVVDADGALLDLNEVGDRVSAAIVAVLDGASESDSLNRLVLTGGLDHEQVTILRALRTYWRRVSPGFTIDYINDAFAAHPAIAADLIALFAARFGPGADDDVEAATVARILGALDEVESLDEDRILRGFLHLILAMVRTNAYRPGCSSLSFKFRSADVPAMPAPAPLFEVFVYGMDVEGIHLRGGAVARGGIRWSTRREDYRTEVLGLMKAQMTKNAVIVPNGAKGGFVLRRPPTDPAELREAVHDAYQIYIRGLLDVTDNLVDGVVVHPSGVRVHDGEDPYLVVAADKGTATFSDTANTIAADYGFWLGDAFASGGSAGYDHKLLGITARGAWESVKWHFRELGVDIMAEPFTVIGVGDMSGDVFGNGMQLSDHIRLLAAFDHRNIFIDPNPEPSVSLAERRRLFALERSSWEDYDTTLLSPGGAVYSRAAKAIELSDEAREALGIQLRSGTPDEVIRAILKAPVDLLWNGGIGTYVKASRESHEEVGDRVNDAVRVNAADLRCRIVGEGGNLGVTQAGRAEFASRGGRVNTDFIDNAGGVHCSDREVNLKILLGMAEERGEINRSERDELVTEVVDDVVDAILYENFLQAQILAQEAEASASRLEAYEDLMLLLEEQRLLDRAIEGLPSSDDMNERARAGLGMALPELSVLLAYAKRSLRDWLLEDEMPDGTMTIDDVHTYFPAAVVERFGHLLDAHPLRRELAATIVANRVVDSEGVTFVSRLMIESGASAGQVVRAYRIARAVTGAGDRWDAIESLMGTLPLDIARRLMVGVDELVESVARWHLANPSPATADAVIEATGAPFAELARNIAEIGPEQWQAARVASVAEWTERGVPKKLAVRHVFQNDLVHAPDIITVASDTGRSVREVAELFLLAGPAFELDWLEEQIAALPAATRWHRRALQAVDDDLVLVRRELAERILEEADDSLDPGAALEHYLVGRVAALGRLTRFMRDLAVDGVDDVAPVVVAIRQIRALAS